VIARGQNWTGINQSLSDDIDPQVQPLERANAQ